MEHNKQTQTHTDTNHPGWKKTLLVCFLILLAGAGVTIVIMLTEPTARRIGATKETAMLIDATTVEKGAFHPTIVTTGTVIPEKDIVLSPRVGGEIIACLEEFTPGGFVNKGETLLQIDPADYEIALNERESALQQALTDLEVEKGRRTIARKDYESMGGQLSDANKALVLREPQMNAAKARVEAARAAVRQAQLDLDRTTIKTPFDAHILSRNVNVGSQVSPGENLGRLVGIEKYWVEATVKLSKIRRLSFSDGPGEEGSIVKVRDRAAWPEGTFRTGVIDKLVGALEGQTRMARVLVSFDDPLCRKENSAGLPPLMIGSFVDVRIQAQEFPDIIRLNRDHLRKNDTVWIFDNGTLHIQEVALSFLDAEYAYIESGLKENDLIVTTNLTTVTEGARLRREKAETEKETTTPDAPGEETRNQPGAEKTNE